MRAGVLAAFACISSSVTGSPALAEPARFEASAFVGVAAFPDDSELGNSWAAEQVPGTGPLLGGRLGWIALAALGPSLELAVEAEVALATGFTGEVAGSTARTSYFAPVLGWRAHAALRYRGARVRPHVVVGGGGESIRSASPFMAKETDPVAYWGPGISVALSDRWLLRADLRHGVMPARDPGVASTIELQLGVSRALGAAVLRGAPRRLEQPPTSPASTPAVAAAPDPDADRDGVPADRDRCPREAEVVNGVADDDGCPEPDPDGDTLVGERDRCPDRAEDRDGVADDDGCPDVDDDGDGLEDARDRCPREAETRNAFDDADGCPDAIPAEVTAALAAASRIAFPPQRARVTTAAKRALEPVLAVLIARPQLRLTITAHADRHGSELAKRRADAIKWHLVDQGITADRLTARAGDAGTPRVELALTPEP